MTYSFKTQVYLADDTEIDVTVEYDAEYQAATYDEPADGELTLCEITADGELPCPMADFLQAVADAEMKMTDDAWDHYQSHKHEGNCDEH